MKNPALTNPLDSWWVAQELPSINFSSFYRLALQPTNKLMTSAEGLAKIDPVFINFIIQHSFINQLSVHS